MCHEGRAFGGYLLSVMRSVGGQTTIMSWLNSTCPSVVVAIYVIRFEGLIGLVEVERELACCHRLNGRHTQLKIARARKRPHNIAWRLPRQMVVIQYAIHR